MAETRQRNAFRGPLTMAGEFPTPSLDEWRELAAKSLHGKPLESLSSEIGAGVRIHPLYTSADQSPPPGTPGRWPFTRGATAPATGELGWGCCPLYDDPDLEVVSGQLNEDRLRGATAAWVRLDRSVRLARDSDSANAGAPRYDGVVARNGADIGRMLIAGDLVTLPMMLDGGGNGLATAAGFVAAARRLGIDLGTARGGFNIDPLGALVGDGELTLGDDRTFDLMGDLASWCLREAPGFRAAAVSTIPYHMAGATTVQETAFALATGVEYLRALEHGGIDPSAACRQLRFVFAVGCDLFAEVARLRAFRRAWAAVAVACGVARDAAAASIHAVTSRRSLAGRDPWVNMLRATGGVFAAAIGGAELITTLPFDRATGPPGDLGRRIALNTHTILREESHLAMVRDPGGGSWYVEKLTDELARAAWSGLQGIEAGGGMRRAVASGAIKELLGEARRTRRQRIATRAIPITGVSTWPDLAEAAPTQAIPANPPWLEQAMEGDATLPVDHPTLATLGRLIGEIDSRPPTGTVFDATIAAAAAGATFAQIASALSTGSTPTTMPALPQERDAEPFERMRDASDACLAHAGNRPRVFLANLGSIAQYTARATFAKNLFEAGGVAVIDRGGFDSIESAAAAFADSGTDLVCLCSADDLYEELGPGLAPAVRARGAKIVFLAGRPGPWQSGSSASRIDHNLHEGCNVLEILAATLSAGQATP